MRKFHDCESLYLSVPCGYCKECVAVKQMYMVQRVRMEALNSFCFFTMLSYNDAHLPRLTTSTGFDIPFADCHDLQLLFKRLRNKNAFGRPFRYLAVCERGSERNRPHFHVLWFLPMRKGELFCDGLSLEKRLFDSILENWSTNVGTDKFPIYEPNCTYKRYFSRGRMRYNYDTHFVVPSLTSSGYNSVAYYCCKYMFKPNPKERRLQQAFRLNLPEDEYNTSWNLVKSRMFCSKGFGYGASHNSQDILAYLSKCISTSDRSLHYPQFFNPDNGQSFPLSPYYKSNPLLYPLSVHSEFFDTAITFDNHSREQIDMAVSEFDRISQIVDKDLSLEFNF